MNGHSIQEPGLLKGRVGLVTGAGTPYGIGRECVKKFAAAGAKVVYACDLNTSSIPSLQEECKKAGYATVIEGRLLDVSNEEQTIAVVKEITKRHGRFDFYIANAGFANYRQVLPIAGHIALGQELTESSGVSTTPRWFITTVKSMS